ncbi:ABC transporter ATP-binding protein [Pannonibacter carbonis]|uniref:ABC transporter ATP-binding protein n=1 Tax=Pannonibacter carbonis TaxID=2067569 RepID=UPI0018E52F3B|nr:ABC transporter ATP-binding protein [Pannonibacter carbonis]
MPIIELDQLRVSILGRDGTEVQPVREVSLSLDTGRTLALVGESGCGKSMTCLAVAGLLPHRTRISGGSFRFEGTDVFSLSSAAAFELRRRNIASVFQDATGSLNPVRTIGWQIAEALRLRRGVTQAEAWTEAVRLLGRVGIPSPEARARDYPHRFSGGMNQRAMIALAIAGRPRLLIADEATTALDVTIQAQILDLIADLQAEMGMAVLLVTHDLGVVARAADDVAVMYAGRVVERAPVRRLFADPRHPYTQGLLGARPRIDRDAARLVTIDGVVPPLNAIPSGCAFAPRCPHADATCERQDPQVAGDGSGRFLACHKPGAVRIAA